MAVVPGGEIRAYMLIAADSSARFAHAPAMHSVPSRGRIKTLAVFRVLQGTRGVRLDFSLLGYNYRRQPQGLLLGRPMCGIVRSLLSSVASLAELSLGQILPWLPFLLLNENNTQWKSSTNLPKCSQCMRTTIAYRVLQMC